MFSKDIRPNQREERESKRTKEGKGDVTARSNNSLARDRKDPIDRLSSQIQGHNLNIL